jgi:hypothetical protein
VATTGGTSGAACDQTWVTQWNAGGYLPATGECNPGQVELKGRLTDACGFSLDAANGAPPLMVPFTASDVFHPEVTAKTEPCGVYWFCLDAGTTLTPLFNAGGSYYPYEVGTLRVTESSSDIEAVTNTQGLEMFCTAALQDVTGLVPTVNPSLPFVVVGMPNGSDGTACDSNQGWTFVLHGPDGGGLNPPYAFIDGQNFVQSDAGGTSLDGIQIFYNLDPAIGTVTVQALKPGNELPDGGELCPLLSTRPDLWPYTGVVPIVSSELSFFYYVIE